MYHGLGRVGKWTVIGPYLCRCFPKNLLQFGSQGTGKTSTWMQPQKIICYLNRMSVSSLAVLSFDVGVPLILDLEQLYMVRFSVCA